MHVLIADPFEAVGVQGIEDLGCQVTHEPTLSGDALAEAVGRLRPDVLVVRSTRVTEASLAAAPPRLVIRAGSGYDTIDVAAASRLGVDVAVCPGMNSIAVAELALGLMLALDRHIPENYVALREGCWRKGEFSKARGLYGRTLGLLGLGAIGVEVAVRARAFGLDVVAWSRSLTPERAEAAGVRALESPLAVAAASDLVSVHLALADETRGMLAEDFFDALRPGTILVNTSRWEVFDPEVLRSAIRAKGLRFATDVWRDEPATASGEYRSDLIDELGAIGTCHIGASTEQAQEAVAQETVRIVGELLLDHPIPNLVGGR